MAGDGFDAVIALPRCCDCGRDVAGHSCGVERNLLLRQYYSLIERYSQQGVRVVDCSGRVCAGVYNVDKSVAGGEACARTFADCGGMVGRIEGSVAACGEFDKLRLRGSLSDGKLWESGASERDLQWKHCGGSQSVVGVEVHDKGGDVRSDESSSSAVGGSVGSGGVPEWRKTATDNVSERTIANREKRERKKARKQRKQSAQFASAFSVCSPSVRKELAESRAMRYIAENKEVVERVQRNGDALSKKIREDKQALACANLQRDLKLALTVDHDKLKKRRDVKIVRDTELSKVQIEKAFGTLSLTDNVSSSQGSVHTIVSGSISPNSSVSEAEVRKLQKDYTDAKKSILDVKKLNDQLVVRLNGIREAFGRSDYDGVARIVDEDCDAMYAASAGVSFDEDGIPLGAADIGGEGTYYDGYYDDSGRFHYGSKELGNWY